MKYLVTTVVVTAGLFGGSTTINSADQQTTQTQGQQGHGQHGQAGQPQPPAQPGQPTVGPLSDAEFVKQAWNGGRLEVELAEVARVHAENDAIEELAMHLERDHRDANAQLHMIADRLDIELPPLPKEHDELENKFEKLTGAAFDRAFLDQIIQSHEKSIALFTQGTKVQNVTLRTFAEATLPKIREHLKRAQDLRGTVTR